MSLQSRYATVDDRNDMVSHWRIPDEWWSRKAEYPWAAQFVRAGDVVADIACGVPHFFKHYLATVADKVYAVDHDENLLDIECKPDNMVLLVNDMWYMPTIPDNSVDRVFCISVLEHLEPHTRSRSMKEMARILKPGGLMITTFDAPNVTPEEYGRLATELHLHWADRVDMVLPSNALYSDKFKLHVFMAVLRKSE